MPWSGTKIFCLFLFLSHFCLVVLGPIEIFSWYSNAAGLDPFMSTKISAYVVTLGPGMQSYLNNKVMMIHLVKIKIWEKMLWLNIK